MGTLVEKLNYLKETKTAIKNAIVAKGVSVSDTDTFRSYANKIGSIKVGSPSQEKSINITKNGSVAVTPDSGYLLSKVNVNVNVASSGGGSGSENNAFIDFSNFEWGDSLYNFITSIDLSSLDTHEATDMSYMFSGCYRLQSLDLSSFYTVYVEWMDFMFQDCGNLVSLNLSSFVTNNVVSMNGMFSRCSKLGTLILGKNWAPNKRMDFIDLSSCTALSHDSLVDIMNKLATRTNSPTIKLSTASKNLLTTSEKAIATRKGWTIA